MVKALAPSLRITALCERVLEEKDGALSLIRLVDRLVITAEGTDLPKELPPGLVPLTALMSWINGLGSYEAKVKVSMPNGSSIESATLPFYLDSLDKVQNHIVRMTLPVKREGIYWFEFLLGDEVKSRVPLRVIYERKEHPKQQNEQSK
jgi:hypothetical protein